MARIPMNQAHRAKQFAPFAALKGYEEALRSKERIKVPKAELCEDMLAELDIIIRQVTPGVIITIIYYDTDEYIKKTGVVTKLNNTTRCIWVVNTMISYQDIYYLSVYE